MPRRQSTDVRPLPSRTDLTGRPRPARRWRVRSDSADRRPRAMPSGARARGRSWSPADRTQPICLGPHRPRRPDWRKELPGGRGATHVAATHHRRRHRRAGSVRTARHRRSHANPRRRTPTTAVPSTRRCPEETPGPLFAGPAQAGTAGPSQRGARPEAAKGQMPPACGPYGEAGRSLASASSPEPAAPSAAIQPSLNGRIVSPGASDSQGDTGSDSSERTLTKEDYRLRWHDLK